VSGGSQGGRQPNEFELELAFSAGLGSQILRLRRSKADATNFSGYTATVVIEQLIWSPHAIDFVELSGTGTSALTNAYLTNTGNYCYPAMIPPPTGGTSGAGTDLAIYGGSAIGTGAGGNILLQAGAFATSGSNGKVIVRGLASNTANLQEWQNNAGTVLAYVSSDASVIGTPSNCYIGANDNSGGQIILYGSAGGYGVGFKTTSSGSEVIRFNSGQIALTVGQGGNNAGLLVNGNLGSSGSVASFVNAGNAASKGIVVKGATSQTGNLQEWQNNAGSVLSAVKSDGSIQPASMADSAATNNSIYYSTTASKLVYKDAAGTVNNLY
jgi:hypothetical protein